jgi:hypothetical protein
MNITSVSIQDVSLVRRLRRRILELRSRVNTLPSGVAAPMLIEASKTHILSFITSFYRRPGTPDSVSGVA